MNTKVADGRVYFNVPQLLKIDMTTSGDALTDRWWLVDFQLIQTNSEKPEKPVTLSETLRSQVIEVANQILIEQDGKQVEQPLHKMFTYLRTCLRGSFSSTRLIERPDTIAMNFKLERLYLQVGLSAIQPCRCSFARQALKLTQAINWLGNISVSMDKDRQAFTTSYWMSVFRSCKQHISGSSTQ